MAANRYISEQSLAKITKILALMEGREFVTVPQVMAACDMGEISACDYLRHMQRDNLVHCMQRAVRYQSGSRPAKWAIGPAPDGPIEIVDPDTERKVIVRSKWEPNHARMALDCYLFGVPAVLQGAGA